MLATRTKKLIEDVKPDAVYVQSSNDWWRLADKLRHVESQEEFENYNKYFKGLNSFKNDGFAPIRKLIFYPRMYITIKLMRWHFNVGYEYNPF